MTKAQLCVITKVFIRFKSIRSYVLEVKPWQKTFCMIKLQKINNEGMGGFYLSQVKVAYKFQEIVKCYSQDI